MYAEAGARPPQGTRRLAKDETKRDELESVLYNLLEAIRVCGILLKPYLPETSSNILKQINSNDLSLTYNDSNTYSVLNPSILFYRIDKDKKLKELEEKKGN